VTNVLVGPFETGDVEPAQPLPARWVEVEPPAFARAFASKDGLLVLLSREAHEDGRRWLHVSVSRRSRLPSWEELRVVKNLFIGPERDAVQWLPPASEYVNAHNYCLHLWHCLDGRIVPGVAP
jgi:hypothetical protein